eukprot:symbB.v1.2.008801.t1/scaffold536.1/size343967/17
MDVLQCAYCGTLEDVDYVCSRCNSCFYCSEDCQRQDWRQHREDCFEQSPEAGDTDTDTIVLEDSAEDSDESQKSEEFQETEAEQDAEAEEAEKGEEGEGEDREIDTRNGMNEEYEDLDVEKDWDYEDEKMQVQDLDQQDDVEDEEEQGGLDEEKDWNHEDEELLNHDLHQQHDAEEEEEQEDVDAGKDWEYEDEEMLDHELDQKHDAEEEEEQEDVDAEKDWEHEDEEMQDEDLDQPDDVEEEDPQDQNVPDMRRTSDSSDAEGVTDSGSDQDQSEMPRHSTRLSSESLGFGVGPLGDLQAGVKMEAYFRLPDGKQSFSPFDGECKESFASGVDVLFEFGIVQHVPWTWVSSVNGKQVLVDVDQARDSGEGSLGQRPGHEVHTTTASSGSEEHNDIHDVKKEQELRQQKEEQEKRHKLLRLGKYLQTKTMHRFRRDARAIRREHAERVKQQEEEQQKKEAELRRKEEEQRRREHQEQQRKAKEEKEARRKAEEERRLAIEEKRREKLEVKALLAKQEEDRQAEEQRRRQAQLEEQRQQRLESERQGEVDWKAKEEQRKNLELQRKQQVRARDEQRKEEEVRRKERLLARKQGYSWRAEVAEAQKHRQGDEPEPEQEKEDAAATRRAQIEMERKQREEQMRQKNARGDDESNKGKSNETYEEKKQRLLALAKQKREEVAATAKSRLSKVKFQGESDEDSDQLEDYMVSTRKQKERAHNQDVNGKESEEASAARAARWQAAEARLEEQRNTCLELQRQAEATHERKVARHSKKDKKTQGEERVPDPAKTVEGVEETQGEEGSTQAELKVEQEQMGDQATSNHEIEQVEAAKRQEEELLRQEQEQEERRQQEEAAKRQEEELLRQEQEQEERRQQEEAAKRQEEELLRQEQEQEERRQQEEAAKRQEEELLRQEQEQEERRQQEEAAKRQEEELLRQEQEQEERRQQEEAAKRQEEELLRQEQEQEERRQQEEAAKRQEEELLRQEQEQEERRQQEEAAKRQEEELLRQEQEQEERRQQEEAAKRQEEELLRQEQEQEERRQQEEAENRQQCQEQGQDKRSQQEEAARQEQDAREAEERRKEESEQRKKSEQESEKTEEKDQKQKSEAEALHRMRSFFAAKRQKVEKYKELGIIQVEGVDQQDLKKTLLELLEKKRLDKLDELSSRRTMLLELLARKRDELQSRPCAAPKPDEEDPEVLALRRRLRSFLQEHGRVPKAEMPDLEVSRRSQESRRKEMEFTVLPEDQEQHVQEKRAPNEEAAAATDAVTSEMTESKVRAEEQPQQEDLPQAVSTEAGFEEHTEVQHDFVKPAETEVKVLEEKEAAQNKEALPQVSDEFHSKEKALTPAEKTPSSEAPFSWKVNGTNGTSESREEKKMELKNRLVGLLQRKRAEQSGPAGHAKEARMFCQEHHIEEKRAPNEDAAAATDAVTSEMTESKVRAEEQPQQEDLPQAVSTEAGFEEHTEVQHDFVKPAETEVKVLEEKEAAQNKEALPQVYDEFHSKEKALNPAEKTRSSEAPCLVGLLQRKRAEQSGPAGHAKEEHHVQEKRAPNGDAAAATDAVTSEMTESKVRAEEQPQKPQQQPLQLAASEEEDVPASSSASMPRLWKTLPAWTTRSQDVPNGTSKTSEVHFQNEVNGTNGTSESREEKKMELKNRLVGLLQRKRAEQSGHAGHAEEIEEVAMEAAPAGPSAVQEEFVNPDDEDLESDESDSEESDGSSEVSDIIPPPPPKPQKSNGTGPRPVVPDSDDEDSSDEEEDFMGILRGIQAHVRPGESAQEAPKKTPAKRAVKEEDALERERKETAKRTLELMEARRMVEVAMEGENAKKKNRKRNIVNKRCNVHLVRQRMDEELAAQERGPRYVNNVAVFVKKGQKDIDANEAEVLVKKDEKEKAKKAKEKEDKQKA